MCDESEIMYYRKIGHESDREVRTKTSNLRRLRKFCSKYRRPISFKFSININFTCSNSDNNPSI